MDCALWILTYLNPDKLCHKKFGIHLDELPSLQVSTPTIFQQNVCHLEHNRRSMAFTEERGEREPRDSGSVAKVRSSALGLEVGGL